MTYLSKINALTEGEILVLMNAINKAKDIDYNFFNKDEGGFVSYDEDITDSVEDMWSGFSENLQKELVFALLVYGTKRKIKQLELGIQKELNIWFYEVERTALQIEGLQDFKHFENVNEHFFSEKKDKGIKFEPLISQAIVRFDMVLDSEAPPSVRFLLLNEITDVANDLFKVKSSFDFLENLIEVKGYRLFDLINYKEMCKIKKRDDSISKKSFSEIMDGIIICKLGELTVKREADETIMKIIDEFNDDYLMKNHGFNLSLDVFIFLKHVFINEVKVFDSKNLGVEDGFKAIPKCLSLLDKYLKVDALSNKLFTFTQKDEDVEININKDELYRMQNIKLSGVSYLHLYNTPKRNKVSQLLIYAMFKEFDSLGEITNLTLSKFNELYPDLELPYSESEKEFKIVLKNLTLKDSLKSDLNCALSSLLYKEVPLYMYPSTNSGLDFLKDARKEAVLKFKNYVSKEVEPLMLGVQMHKDIQNKPIEKQNLRKF